MVKLMAMSTRTTATEEATIAGSLLLAHPDLHDGNFRRTVVLISAHTREDGALGVVMNRPLDRTLGEVHGEFAFGPLASVDREHAMWRNAAQRLAKVEVVMKLLILLRVVFLFYARELASLAIELADFLADLGVFAELFGQNMAGAQEGRDPDHARGEDG